MSKQNGDSPPPTPNGTGGGPKPEPLSGASGPGAQYLQEVVEPGVDEQLPTGIKNLLSKDYPLANIRRSDREYFRLLSENIAHYVREQFPPEDSLVQGDLGAALLEDPDYNTYAKTIEDTNQIESVLMDAFARTSRGEGGWQQEKFTENIQTRRVEDEREEDSGGIFSGVFG